MTAASMILADGGWLVGSIVPGLIIVLLGAILLREHLRKLTLRRKHGATHPAISADEFVAQVGLPGEADKIVLGVRRAIADRMGVPAESLYASDSLGYVSSFGFDNMDFLEVSFAIEAELQVRLSRRFWEPLFSSAAEAGSLPVSEVARFMVRNFNSPGCATRGKSRERH